ARALDEGDDDLVRARLDVERNVREAAHDLGPAGRAAAIREREILWAADVGSKHLLPVDEHDERVLRLDGAGIQADAEILEPPPSRAPRREHVLATYAAPRAQRP